MKGSIELAHARYLAEESRCRAPAHNTMHIHKLTFLPLEQFPIYYSKVLELGAVDYLGLSF